MHHRFNYVTQIDTADAIFLTSSSNSRNTEASTVKVTGLDDNWSTTEKQSVTVTFQVPFMLNRQKIICFLQFYVILKWKDFKLDSETSLTETIDQLNSEWFDQMLQ